MESRPEKVMVLTALDLEARAVACALGLRRSAAKHVWVGPGVEVRAIGMAAGALPANFGGARGIILAGLAAGVDPTLRAGDVVVDETSRPPALMSGARLGRIASVPAILTSAQVKASIFRGTGALAAEMEAAFVRRVIDPLGLPFLHLRAISDAADEELDPSLGQWVDPFGRPGLGKLGWAVLRRPRLLMTLWHLKQNTALATARLADAVREIIDGGWPQP